MWLAELLPISPFYVSIQFFDKFSFLNDTYSYTKNPRSLSIIKPNQNTLTYIYFAF